MRPVTEPHIPARSNSRLRVLPAPASRTAPREAVAVDPAAARADVLLASVGKYSVVALALNIAWIALT